MNSDILSFYKEDLAGETANRTTVLATVNKQSKQQALSGLVDETVAAYLNALAVLEKDPEALASLKNFAAGYLCFHFAVNTRYRLSELTLQRLAALEP